jgi:hypothetical protein
MVLSHIRQATLTLNRLVSMVRQFPQQSTLPLTLGNFLKLHPHIDIHELYKRASWSELMARANNEVREALPDHLSMTQLEKAIKTRILTCDDYHYLNFLKTLCETNGDYNVVDSRFMLMFHYDFWQKSGSELGINSLEQSLQSMKLHLWRDLLLDVIRLQLKQIKHEQLKMDRLPEVSLRLHARYAREQILVGFGATTFERQPPAREGVFVIPEQNIELLFVTLNKNEKQFSPTTMYHDYAINEDLFHWQSQNSARPDRGKGKEYIEHRSLAKRLFLFVREQTKDEYGRTMGFVNFGEVDYVSHTGSQPMSITWRLKNPMPSFMWQDAAKLAVG